MAKTASVVAIAVVLALACGPREPAASPPDPAAAATPEASAPALAPAPEPAPAPAEAVPAAPESSAAPPAPASSEPSLRELCAEVCARVAGKCSASVAESCRINCDQYDKTAAPCESTARQALRCAESAPNLPCANVAPDSCGKEFQRVAECQKAPDSFRVAGADAPAGLPAGWARIEPEGGGFGAVMPAGVERKDAGNESVWVASSGGVRYVVRKLPPPAEKFTPKSQVRLAMAWLKPCNLRLRLHGHVEKGDRTSVHYASGCKDGGERQGVFHLTPTALYIVGTEAPAGQRGELDAFVYGFRPISGSAP